jgi:ABC-2 type transport system permease protein
MFGLLKSELRKLTSTRMTWILVAVTVFIGALYVSLYALMAGYDTGSGQSVLPPLTSEISVRMTFTAVSMGYITILVFGIVGATSEYRHRTATLTYLASPKRWHVIAMKFLAHGIFAAAIGVINIAINIPLALWIVGTKDHWVMPGDDIKSIGIATIVAFMLYSVLGVAIGALIKNQVAAIVGALTWVTLIERLFTFLLPDVGKWMPAGAADAMLQARSLNGGTYLQPMQGALLLFGYAVIFAVIASVTTARQDVS